jgi:ribonucleoside-diphosphate reductase alpha chain
MRWLASRFLDTDTQEELGILTPEVRARKSGQDAATATASDTVGPSHGNGGNGSPKAKPAAAPDNAAPGTTAPAPPADPPKPATSALTDTPPVQPARLVGLELGPACSNCGGMMQRTGSCYTCSSCGNNTGCG